MSEHTALIVDDEPDILELLDITLSRMGLNVHKAPNIAAAQKLLKEFHFDLCLTDMHLPDGNGIELVSQIQKTYPETPVAVITAFGSMEVAISALKAGAFDFVSKPVELPRLRDMVKQALKINHPKTDQETAQENSSTLLGNSEPIQKLRKQIEKVARSQAPIYISGESGSGKELAARQIHALGPRCDQPFVPVNCGAIPSELMESEFFGHRKGSFTGAVADKNGLFQCAHDGTLFLDEVADLPLHMQVKLLRAIQEKSVRPVGAEQEIPIDIRILSATHKDLAKEVESGNFRQDLFYRINVIEIRVPSLRERLSDVPLLLDNCLQKLATQTGNPKAVISEQAMSSLGAYHFPGNVRELENTLERAYTLCEDNLINVQDLQLGSSHEPHDTMGTTNTVTEKPVSVGDSLDDYLEEIEKQAILKALEETRWNRTAAAEKLGISFRQMRHRLKKFGIE